MRYIKKSLSLVASAIGVLLVSGFLSLRPISQSPAMAHHTDNPTGCYDAVMAAGNTLTDPGSPDAGRLDFNAFNHDYQACVESKLASDNGVKGWVWNNNLGYVSLSCGSGDNLGAGCGGVDYGVTANPTDGNGAIDGRVRGFAWGDNIGWISMGCDADQQNMGVPCGAVQYGVRVAKVDNEIDPMTGAVAACMGPPGTVNVKKDDVYVKKDDVYGYAWSDSVGWINFCGSHFYLFNPPPVITTMHLRYTSSVPVMYANGDHYYTILAEVKRDGVLVAGEPQPVNATIETVDFVNALKADQIADVGDGASGLVPTAKTDFTWDTNLGAYVAKVRAVAPTNVTHINNYLRLNSVGVKIDGVNYLLQENSKYFDFNPAISVVQVNYDAAPGEVGDSLFGIAGQTTNHQILVSKYLPQTDANFVGSRIFTQLHDCSDDFDFFYDVGQAGGGVADGIANGQGVCAGKPNDPTLFDIDKGSDLGQGIPLADLVDTVPVDPNAGTYIRGIGVKIQDGQNPAKAANTKAFGLVSRVSYDAKTLGGALIASVKYVSHKTDDSSLVSQAADVRGNVRIDTQKTILADSIQKSIGAAAQSRREPFYRAIKQLAAPSDLAAPKIFVTNDFNVGSSLYYYRRPKNGATCQVVIGNGADVQSNKDVTIVAEGCDVYIDSNVRMDLAAGKQLGIIALEDIRSNAVHRGGNVYVCSNVTDIIGTHIVADGGILSYNCGNKVDPGVINQTDGLPVFPASPRTSLANQLTITGSLITNNTYGGSLLSPPILGDGTILNNPADAYKARLFDLNFLRYANTVSDGNGGECWDGSLSATLPQGCVNNNPANSSIVNVKYQTPAGDLPVFGSVGK